MHRWSKIGLFLSILLLPTVTYVACKTPQSKDSSNLQSSEVTVGRQIHQDMQRELSYSVRNLTYAGQRISPRINEDYMVRREAISTARAHYSLVSRYEAILDMILRTGGSNQQGSTMKVKSQSVQEVVDDLKTSISLFSKVAGLEPRDIITANEIQLLKTAIVEGLQLSNRILANLKTWGVSDKQNLPPPPVDNKASPNGPPGPSPFVHQKILPANQQAQQNANPGNQQMPQELDKPVPQPIQVMNSMSTVFDRMSDIEKVKSMGIINRHDFSKIIQDNKDKSAAEYATALLKPFIKGDLETLLRADAGISEGYSIYQHTNMVLQIFHSQRRGYKILYDGNVKMDLYYLLPAVLIMHDIGKPIAVYKGDKNMQHLFSTPIAEAVLTAMGYTSAEVKLAKRLIDNDILGGAMYYAGTSMKGVSGKLMEQVAKSLINQSEDTGLYPEQFTELQKLYYISDAASYPGLRQSVFTSTWSPLCNNDGLLCGRNGLLESIGYWTEYYTSNKDMEKPLTPSDLYRKRTQAPVANKPPVAIQPNVGQNPNQVNQAQNNQQGSVQNQPTPGGQQQNQGVFDQFDDPSQAAPKGQIQAKPPTIYPPVNAQKIKVIQNLPNPWG